MERKRSPIGVEADAVLAEITSRLSNLFLMRGEGAEAHQPRNIVLELASRAIGQARMHRYAAHHLEKSDSRDGSVQTTLFGAAYPGGSEHARALSTSFQRKAELLANLACGLCPLQGDCGIGGEELVKLLEEPKDRRRFVDRVRKDSNRYCETNLKPGRLSKREK